ncbi:MAG: M48 family metalloprotease [Alphaproteobacteria bacterium]|nr:M48 family metalloprotease [Alphaproteobacteria bacterium]
MNTLRTGILMAALTGLFVAVGWGLGGTMGMLIALAVAAVSNAMAYWHSDKMVLALYGATPAPAGGELVHLVARLAELAQLPAPQVYVCDSPQPNAFATGRDPRHAALCVTSGLLGLVSREELAGVVAHELSHIKHRDTLIMTLVATLAGAVSMLANLALFAGLFGTVRGERGSSAGGPGAILIALLAPIAALLVQMAISRSREFEADREAAALLGRPHWLASALAHISAGAQEISNPVAERHPATAHLFIVMPLHAGALSNLFSSHPSTAERIARLTRMAAGRSASHASSPWR